MKIPQEIKDQIEDSLIKGFSKLQNEMYICGGEYGYQLAASELEAKDKRIAELEEQIRQMTLPNNIDY
jgi:hypothetical protein